MKSIKIKSNKISFEEADDEECHKKKVKCHSDSWYKEGINKQSEEELLFPWNFPCINFKKKNGNINKSKLQQC